MLDILIRNGRVVDGTGNPWFKGYVGLQGDRIECMGRGESNVDANTVIDAEGLVVAPGFIDLHTHSDASVLVHNTGDSTLQAGVTTEGVGQCGFSVYPVTAANREALRHRIASSSEVDAADIEVGWNDLDGWLTTLERKGLGYNIAPYIGHGTIRSLVMGEEGSGGERIEPTPAELEEMKRLVSEAMEQGAFALSTGLEYAPARNATTDELLALCRVAAAHNGAHISHVRSEDERVVSATEELIELAERTPIASSASHHKSVGKDNWGKVHHTLRLIDEARDRGVDVMVDFYPWRYFAQSNLGSFFFANPADVPENREEVMSMLQDENTWEQLKSDINHYFVKARERFERRRQALARYGIQVGPYDRFDPEVRCVVYSPTHPELEELTIGQVQRQLGYDHAHDALRQLYLEDEGRTLLAGGVMHEQDIITILEYDHSAVSTDGSTFSGPRKLDQPRCSAHPRNYGSYAKILGYFVREKGVVSLEEAVRKLTSLPAHLLGITDRGLLREGLHADITVFDPERIANRATYAKPDVPPAGIEYVLVNGRTALDRGELTGTLSGRALRAN